MKRKIRNIILPCLLAGVLSVSSGCGLVKNMVASMFGHSSAETEGTVQAVSRPEREASNDYYKEVDHEDLTLSERSRSTFDEDAYEQCCADFEKLMKKNGNDQALLEKYEEILDWIDALTTDYSLCNYDYYKDVTDEAAGDALSDLEQLYMDCADRALILFRDTLDTEYGELLREEMGDDLADEIADYEDLTPEEKELSERRTDLVQRYDALSIDDSADADERAQEMKEIYLALINVNNQLAFLSGYDNYAEYAYAETYQRDFTTEDVEIVEEEVIAELVPLYLAWVDALIRDGAIYEVYEPNYDDPETVWGLIQNIIDDAFPELSESLEYLLRNELYDMDYSDTKMDVGFTSTMPAWNDAYIFNQPYQECLDYRTYIHEFGHYNHYYHIDERSLFESSTLDVDEIHSQGLELLFYDYYPALSSKFGKGMQQNAIYNLLSNVLTGLAVNEAECRAFAAGDLTVEELDAIWEEVDEKYGLQGFIGPDSWFEISHVFESPLYYISYGTSALASFEIFTLAREDWEAGVDCYLSLTAVPTTETYCEVLEDAGLANIFEPGTIKELCASLAKTLKIESSWNKYKKNTAIGYGTAV